MDLSEFFKTKSQSNDFSARIASVSEKIYQTDFNLEKSLMNEFGMQTKDKFVTLLRENKINSQSQEALKSFLDLMQKSISTTPILDLTVAFEPKEETLKLISEWLIVNIKKQIILDVHIDESIIAGAVVKFSGKHGDFSTKSKFDEILNQISKNPQPQQINSTTNTVPKNVVQHINPPLMPIQES